MAVKEWVKRFQPITLYIVLVLTTFYFLVQLVVSYVSHALTLTVDSYLMLCNLIALLGCAFSIKYGGREDITENLSVKNAPSTANCSVVNDNRTIEMATTVDSCSKQCISSKGTCFCTVDINSLKSGNQRASPERRLRNTFGWARIEVLLMLVGCVFFASLCFTILPDALRTLLHITHRDEMHHPIPVFCVGAFGLFLNGLCYLLIGGYTLHQGTFLKITSTGVVILESVLPSTSGDNNAKGDRISLYSRSRKNGEQSPEGIPLKRQGPWELCRDAIGCIFVMVCALIVYFTDSSVAKYVDPILAVISASLLLFLSYPYMKESCLILLQIIPNHINIDSMCAQLMKVFPDIINVHDLHVWQLTADKTICTAHVIFLNPQVYTRNTKRIIDFFIEQGITHVTLQPEFFQDGNCIAAVPRDGLDQCLVKCRKVECFEHYCCDMTSILEELHSVQVDKSEVFCFGRRKSSQKNSRAEDPTLQNVSKKIDETSEVEKSDLDDHQQLSPPPAQTFEQKTSGCSTDNTKNIDENCTDKEESAKKEEVQTELSPPPAQTFEQKTSGCSTDDSKNIDENCTDKEESEESAKKRKFV